MGNWLQPLTGLATLCLQSHCPLCQRSTSQILCNACEQQLQQFQLPRTEQVWQAPLPVFAWGSYSGSLKRAIAALKYEQHPQLARPLGDWLAQHWLTCDFAPRKTMTVVPIPIHAERRKQRGFNQAELIAEAFCQRTGFKLYRQGLTRDRATEAQFGLSAELREQNLSGAFAIGPDFLKRAPKFPVLLLDDIYTTGATVRSAAQILRRHQISVCGVVAVARTQFSQTSL